MPIPNAIPAHSLDIVSVSRCWMTWLGQREAVLRRIAILTVLYLIPANWILTPVVIDPDIWWHLQSGKWIVEHGALPTTDPFSTYGEGKPWVAYSWLFEIGMYQLVHLFGESAIIFYTLVGIWLIMLMMHRIIVARGHHFLIACALLTVCMLAISGLYTPRPWLFTIFFFGITLQVVLSLREGRQSRWIWLLPLAYIAWANVHIQFIYGLGLLGLACVAPLLDRYALPFTGTQPLMVWGSSQWKRLIVLTVFCTLATMVTPHHVRLYSIVLQLSAQTGMWEYTQEMQAPAFRDAAGWAMLLLFGVALMQLGWRRPWSSFEILLLVVAAVSAFRGRRDAWFLVMAALTVLVPKKSGQGQNQSSIVSPSGITTVVICVSFCVAWIVDYRGVLSERVKENTAKIYPLKAATFVEQEGLSGPLYNHFNWGGYLIWRLPHLKVSMDGRANVHGDERIKQSIATWAGGHHWNDDPELKEATLIIAEKNMALASLLRLDSRFQVIHEDETAIVLIRTTHDKKQSNLPESGTSSPKPMPVEFAFAHQ